MAIRGGFYDSQNGDRKYYQTDHSRLFNALLNDGVFANVGNSYLVRSSTGMNVIVGTGMSWFNNYWQYNDTDELLTVDAADSIFPRNDLVVLEVNNTDAVRDPILKIKKGTPATVPLDPELIRSALVNEYALARISLAVGQSTITQTNITNMVGIGDTPFITGILDIIDAGELVAQWDAEFNAWWDELKEILNENVVGELTNRIEAVETDLSNLVTTNTKTIYNSTSVDETLQHATPQWLSRSMLFVTTTSATALDYVFGKNQVQNEVSGLGIALQKYALHNGVPSGLESLRNVDSLLDLTAAQKSLIYFNPTLKALFDKSPYAKSILEGSMVDIIRGVKKNPIQFNALLDAKDPFISLMISDTYKNITFENKVVKTSGTNAVYTVPSWATAVTCIVVGGGGGGGTSAKNSSGGGAGTIKQSCVSVTPGQTLRYTIGAGGAGSRPANYGYGSGAAGGTSSVTGVVSAVGGGGGTAGASSIGGSGLGPFLLKAGEGGKSLNERDGVSGGGSPWNPSEYCTSGGGGGYGGGNGGTAVNTSSGGRAAGGVGTAQVGNGGGGLGGRYNTNSVSRGAGGGGAGYGGGGAGNLRNNTWTGNEGNGGAGVVVFLPA